MKTLLACLCLLSTLLIGAPARADDLADTPIYAHPTDFPTAQALALQNRQDRIAMLQTSIACMQQASTIDQIHLCQDEESRTLDKLWLTYCDTNVSFPTAKKSNKTSATGAPAAPTECEMAMKVNMARRRAEAAAQTPAK